MESREDRPSPNVQTFFSGLFVRVFGLAAFFAPLQVIRELDQCIQNSDGEEEAKVPPRLA